MYTLRYVCYFRISSLLHQGFVIYIARFNCIINQHLKPSINNSEPQACNRVQLLLYIIGRAVPRALVLAVPTLVPDIYTLEENEAQSWFPPSSCCRLPSSASQRQRIESRYCVVSFVRSYLNILQNVSYFRERVLSVHFHTWTTYVLAV